MGGAGGLEGGAVGGGGASADGEAVVFTEPCMVVGRAAGYCLTVPLVSAGRSPLPDGLQSTSRPNKRAKPCSPLRIRPIGRP